MRALLTLAYPGVGGNLAVQAVAGGSRAEQGLAAGWVAAAQVFGMGPDHTWVLAEAVLEAVLA